MCNAIGKESGRHVDDLEPWRYCREIKLVCVVAAVVPMVRV